MIESYANGAALAQAEFSYEPETLPSEMPHVDKDLELVARELEGGVTNSGAQA